MTTTSEWIKTEYVRRVPEHRPNKIGVHLVPSPYDVPAAFRASWMSPDTAMIEFRYIDSVEDVEDIYMSGGIKASIGKETRRLMSIQFKPEHHDIAHVIETLHRIIQQLSEKENLRSQAKWNFKAAREAIDQTFAADGAKFGAFLQPCAV